ISTIVVEDAGCRAELARRAIHRFSNAAARFALFRSPIKIAGHEEIQMPVVIVIKKSGRGRPTAYSYFCLGRYVGEGPIAVVVVKDVSPEICDVDVWQSI